MYILLQVIFKNCTRRNFLGLLCSQIATKTDFSQIKKQNTAPHVCNIKNKP